MSVFFRGGKFLVKAGGIFCLYHFSWNLIADCFVTHAWCPLSVFFQIGKFLVEAGVILIMGSYSWKLVWRLIFSSLLALLYVFFSKICVCAWQCTKCWNQGGGVFSLQNKPENTYTLLFKTFAHLWQRMWVTESAGTGGFKGSFFFFFLFLNLTLICIHSVLEDWRNRSEYS